MRRLLLTLGTLSFFVVGLTLAFNAKASNPTLLIMAEDEDGETIPRNNRISTRILNELVNQLDGRGFDVYDETAVTLRTHAQGRTRRSDACCRLGCAGRAFMLSLGAESLQTGRERRRPTHSSERTEDSFPEA